MECYFMFEILVEIKKMEIILVTWIVVIKTLTADIRETKQF